MNEEQHINQFSYKRSKRTKKGAWIKTAREVIESAYEPGDTPEERRRNELRDEILAGRGLPEEVSDLCRRWTELSEDFCYMAHANRMYPRSCLPDFDALREALTQPSLNSLIEKW